MAGANFGYLFRGALEEDNVSCLWDTNTTTDIMQYAVPATIASSFLSIAGSILIIFTFVMWKDVRKSVARRILLFLAIADLLGALGYFCGGIFTYIWKENITMCRIQSFWTTYFPVVSFFWTAYLAIYFVVALVLKKPNWTNKLMVPFHLTAWTIPLVICVVFTIMDYLGPNPTHNTNNTILRSQVAVGWCYVSSGIFENVTDDIGFFIYRMHIYFFVEAVSGKMWEMLAYCVVIVSYCLIVCSNRCKCCKVIVFHV